MSAPVDLHTLGIVVAALGRALEFQWASAADPDAVAPARQACHATLKWGERLCKGEELPPGTPEEPEA